MEHKIEKFVEKFVFEVKVSCDGDRSNPTMKSDVNIVGSRDAVRFGLVSLFNEHPHVKEVFKDIIEVSDDFDEFLGN